MQPCLLVLLLVLLLASLLPVPGVPRDAASWSEAHGRGLDALKCEVAFVGASLVQTKTVEIPWMGMACGGTPQNIEQVDVVDTFRVSIDRGNMLTVNRTDRTDGWGQPLELLCCPPQAMQYVGCYWEGASEMLHCGLSSIGYGHTTETCAAACGAHVHFALSDASCCACGDSYAAGVFRGEVLEGVLPTTQRCGDEGTWAVFAHGTSCQGPSDILNTSGARSCAQGATVRHGGACTAQCEGDYLPSHNSLQCAFGRFSPVETFICNETFDHCDALVVAYGNNVRSCLEGDHIVHGGTCSAQCQTHYAPNDALLVCSDGVLMPAFECVGIPCAAPTPRYMYTTGIIAVERQSCLEGAVIPHGASCNVVCDIGHMPTASEPLLCIGGALSPSTFSCTAACTVDTDCGGRGACIERRGLERFCRCDDFFEDDIAVAWRYRTVSLGAPNLGVMATDDRAGTGFIMYSEEMVASRFAPQAPPNVSTPHLIVVSRTADGSGWEYDDKVQRVAFEPRESDLLIANVDFENGTAVLLSGALGLVEEGGIRRGFWKHDVTIAVSTNVSWYSDLDECNVQEADPPEAARAASSVLLGNASEHGHHFGRLSSPHAWSPAEDALGEWYVVDAGELETVLGVITKGRADADEWVTDLYMDWSVDGTTWEEIDARRWFSANTDRDTAKVIEFPARLHARYIRLNPVQWHGHISLRAGLLVCGWGDLNVGEFSVSIVGALVVLDRCTQPSTVDIPDSQRSASSVEGDDLPGFGYHRGRLDSSGAWTAAAGVYPGEGLWYQLAFDSTELVAKVVVKGRADKDEWITAFTLRASDDGSKWIDIASGRVFSGSTDRETEVFVDLGAPTKARFLRLYPRTWRSPGQASMRMGVVICRPPTTIAFAAYSGAYCTTPPGDEWALFNREPLPHYWEIRELRFFGDIDCTIPLDSSTPISSGAAFIEHSRATRGPVEQSAAHAFDGKPYTTWASQCAFPCEAGSAYLGVKLSTPAAVRCVQLQQHGDAARTVGAVELRARVGRLSVIAWTSVMTWHGLPKHCRGGSSCTLAAFSA